MYRWVGENGVTVYSQTPPPSGNAVQIKKQPSPSADDASAARDRTKKRREQAFDEGEARQEAEAAQAQQVKKAEDDGRRAANCEAAQANLEKIQNLGRRRVRTPDGTVLRLSEEQVRTQIEKARMQIEDYCK
jgi:hypothetical protein